jgi:hypothetical protein
MAPSGTMPLIGAARHALEPLGLVQQVGEFGPRALEAGGVDVGDVVGDDFQVELLGVHAGGGDRERFHVILLRSPCG